MQRLVSKNANQNYKHTIETKVTVILTFGSHICPSSVYTALD